jgi:hypothetical protein
LADSGASRNEPLRAIAQAGFTPWSVRDNQWATGPERTAAALPANAWSPAAETRWRNGVEGTEHQAGIRHTPAESDLTFTLAVARWKKDDERFWRCAFVAHDGRCTGPAALPAPWPPLSDPTRSPPGSRLENPPVRKRLFQNAPAAGQGFMLTPKIKTFDFSQCHYLNGPQVFTVIQPSTAKRSE